MLFESLRRRNKKIYKNLKRNLFNSSNLNEIYLSFNVSSDTGSCSCFSWGFTQVLV